MAKSRRIELPQFVPSKELPIFGATDFDRVALVKQALTEMEAGSFVLASQMVDAMGRDDRIQAVLQQRVEALFGLPFSMQSAAMGGPKADTAREETERLWPSMTPASALTEMLSWGLMLGLAPAQDTYEQREGRWIPTLKAWHPRYLRFDWGTRTFRIIALEGERTLTPGEDGWVLYMPHGGERGWMKGLARSLAIPWLVRQFAMRDWARYSEVHGRPIKKAIVPKSAQEKDKQRFRDQIATLATESTILLEQQQNGQTQEKYDMELVEALGRSDEGFDRLIARCDTAIAVRVLGQNLTTEVKDGSRAAASVHERVSLRKLAFDASTLGECMREQRLKPFARFNHGDAELAPHPVYDTTPPEDLNARAATYKALGEGLQALQKARVAVDVVAEAERFGVALAASADAPTPDEEAARDATPSARRAAMALLSASEPTGAQRGQGYADALAAAAAREGGATLAGDVAALLFEIEAASSYEDLQARLLRVYEHMNPAQLAHLTERSLLLAQLAGMNAVREDT